MQFIIIWWFHLVSIGVRFDRVLFVRNVRGLVLVGPAALGRGAGHGVRVTAQANWQTFAVLWLLFCSVLGRVGLVSATAGGVLAACRLFCSRLLSESILFY